MTSLNVWVSLFVRLLLGLVLAAFAAGLIYGAFRLTQSLRSGPGDALVEDEGSF